MAHGKIGENSSKDEIDCCKMQQILIKENHAWKEKKELFTWSANRVRIGKELGQIKTVTS